MALGEKMRIDDGTGLRQRRGQFVMVSHHNVDAVRRGIGNSLCGIDTCVTGYDQGYRRGELLCERRQGDAVRLGLPHRYAVPDIRSQIPQAYHEHGRRSLPINIEIAPDQDRLTGLDCAPHPCHRRSHTG